MGSLSKNTIEKIETCCSVKSSNVSLDKINIKKLPKSYADFLKRFDGVKGNGYEIFGYKENIKVLTNLNDDILIGSYNRNNKVFLNSKGEVLQINNSGIYKIAKDFESFINKDVLGESLCNHVTEEYVELNDINWGYKLKAIDSITPFHLYGSHYRNTLDSKLLKINESTITDFDLSNCNDYFDIFDLFFSTFSAPQELIDEAILFLREFSFESMIEMRDPDVEIGEAHEDIVLKSLLLGDPSSAIYSKNHDSFALSACFVYLNKAFIFNYDETYKRVFFRFANYQHLLSNGKKFVKILVDGVLQNIIDHFEKFNIALHILFEDSEYFNNGMTHLSAFEFVAAYDEKSDDIYFDREVETMCYEPLWSVEINDNITVNSEGEEVEEESEPTSSDIMITTDINSVVITKNDDFYYRASNAVIFRMPHDPFVEHHMYFYFLSHAINFYGYCLAYLNNIEVDGLDLFMADIEEGIYEMSNNEEHPVCKPSKPWFITHVKNQSGDAVGWSISSESLLKYRFQEGKESEEQKEIGEMVDSEYIDLVIGYQLFPRPNKDYLFEPEEFTGELFSNLKIMSATPELYSACIAIVNGNATVDMVQNAVDLAENGRAFFDA